MLYVCFLQDLSTMNILDPIICARYFYDFRQ